MKRLFSLLLVLVLSFSVLSVGVYAKENKKIKPKSVELADEIMKTAKNKDDIEKQLKKAGWEVQIKDGTDVSDLSSGGCGKIINGPLFYDSEDNLYMVYAEWDYNSSCSFDNGSDGAPDYLALGVVTNTNISADQLAQYANIIIKDEDGDIHNNVGNVSGYYGGGATYTFNDEDGIVDNVGDNGRAWFYIKRPTNGSSYYIRSQWTHTWSNSSVSLNKLTIGYPWLVSAEWSNTSALDSWTIADQDSTF